MSARLRCAILIVALLPISSRADDDRDVPKPAGKVVAHLPQTAVGRFWIGVGCHQVSEEQAASLGVKGGLLVDKVVDGSPAAKAGLHSGDVIVSVIGKPVEGLQHLAEAVNLAAGHKLRLSIARNKESKEIEIATALRPEEEDEDEDEDDEQNKLLSRLRQQLIMRSSKPRVSVTTGTPLPADMQVIVKKRGKEPARITVKQGESVWKTTEKHLDMLPTSARLYAARLLGTTNPRQVSDV